MSSAAQEEFDRLVAAGIPRVTRHPEDQDTSDDDDDDLALELTEEEMFRNAQIEATMRMPVGGSTNYPLPPRSFDSGHATGVKGVIADARHYQSARRSQFGRRSNNINNNGNGNGNGSSSTPRTTTLRNGSGGVHSGSEDGSDDRDLDLELDLDDDDDDDDDDDEDAAFTSGGGRGDEKGEEEFLKQWRETRRRELESDSARTVRTRRTSPSVRVYGRLDEVDALGYLDAIEIVGRATTVVVFVYDHECEVSATIDVAIQPLVQKHPGVHFVKIHYEEIEFDNAAVPAILAYRNQGDLVANLTGLIEMMPDEDCFGADELEHLLRAHAVL